MEEKKQNGQFKKVIGLFGGISLVAGMTIGSGVYYLGSYVLERTDFSFGLALLCWVIGGIVSILGGLCFAELGASRPVAGGMTVYLSEAYHPALGFVNGFSGFVLTCSGSIASLAMAAVEGFRGTLGLNDLAIKLIAILIIVFFTALNLRGAKMGVAFQNFTMVARVIPLVLIILIGIFMGDQSVDMSLSMEGTRAEGGGITGMISMIAFATFASLWAYEGWTNLNTVGEEMKNPKKDLPLAIIISMVGITAIYTLFQFAIYRVLPADQIISSIQGGDIYLGNAVAEKLMGGFGKGLILAGMTIGILGTVNGDVLVFPRTYYAMAKSGYFPKKFAEIDEKTGVPVSATLASSGIAIILVIFNSLQSLTDLLITLSALMNVLCVAAVLVYRKKYPNLERPYKVWGGTFTVILTMILFGVLLVNNFIEAPMAAVAGLGIPAAGMVLYFYYYKKNGGKTYSDIEE
ncbi:MAG: amino acid permease [Firmicutes bacterium]|nr:amino acid permease [Bacillota bacterium]